jgi:hypothetical protein
LATSNDEPGFARLFHFPLNTNLPVSIPFLQYDLVFLTDLWNPAGSIHQKQIVENIVFISVGYGCRTGFDSNEFIF